LEIVQSCGEENKILHKYIKNLRLRENGKESARMNTGDKLQNVCRRYRVF